MVLRPRVGSHVSVHFAFSLNLLKRPESVEVGEGALAKLLAGKVWGFFSVSSAATGALAPFRQSHVSLPTSAVKAPSLANICGDVALPYLHGFAQRMLLSKWFTKKRVTREGLANICHDPSYFGPQGLSVL